MLLLNYDFYDIHSVLTILRAKPEKGCNVEIIKAVLEILSAEQIGNTIESNIVIDKIMANNFFIALPPCFFLLDFISNQKTNTAH